MSMTPMNHSQAFVLLRMLMALLSIRQTNAPNNSIRFFIRPPYALILPPPLTLSICLLIALEDFEPEIYNIV